MKPNIWRPVIVTIHAHSAGSPSVLELERNHRSCCVRGHSWCVKVANDSLRTSPPSLGPHHARSGAVLGPPRAGGWTCNTVNGPGWASSPSCDGSGTRSWPGGRSGWACGTAACASPCWCRRWRRTRAPAPWSGTWSRGTASCVSSVHLGREGKNTARSVKVDNSNQPRLCCCWRDLFVLDEAQMSGFPRHKAVMTRYLSQ